MLRFLPNRHFFPLRAVVAVVVVALVDGMIKWPKEDCGQIMHRTKMLKSFAISKKFLGYYTEITGDADDRQTVN